MVRVAKVGLVYKNIFRIRIHKPNKNQDLLQNHQWLYMFCVIMLFRWVVC